MKKTICTAALAAVISFGTVYAAPMSYNKISTAQQDTVKKKMKMKDGKKKMKMKTDTSKVMKHKMKMKKDSV